MDSATDAPALACPGGLPGPALVELTAPSGTSYCIDQREVTAAEYKAFVDATKSTAPKQSPECSWNEVFEPITDDPEKSGEPGHCASGYYDPVKSPDRAVVCVDWCDAAAYCAWAGKRLCGAIGGGTATLSKLNDPTVSEWANACTQGGKTTYPWGDSYSPGSCVDPAKLEAEGPAARNVVNVEASTCHGALPGFDQIYDLVGSAQEWVAECEAPGQGCALYGYGSMHSADVPVSCEGVGPTSQYTTHLEIGFRCCADPTK